MAGDMGQLRSRVVRSILKCLLYVLWLMELEECQEACSSCSTVTWTMIGSEHDRIHVPSLLGTVWNNSLLQSLYYSGSESALLLV